MIREKIIKLLGGYTEDTVKTMQEVIDCNVNLLKEQSKNTFTVSSFRRMEDIPFSPDYRSEEELKNEMWNEITEQLKKQVDIKKYKTEGAYAYVLLLSVRRENEEKVKI